MYVRKDCTRVDHSFGLERVRDIIGKTRSYKKNAEWDAPDIATHTITFEGESVTYDMDDWLNLLGIFISDGHTPVGYTHMTRLTAFKKRKIDHIVEV